MFEVDFSAGVNALWNHERLSRSPWNFGVAIR